jgi:hypothetical protein
VAQLFSLGRIARTMRFTFTFVLLSLLFIGCSRRDAKFRDQVTGTWTLNDKFETRLSADGSFVSHWALSNKSLTYQGTWKIQDAVMVSTLTNCIAEGTTNFERVGSVDYFAIIRADSTGLVFSNNNQMISFTRK